MGPCVLLVGFIRDNNHENHYSFIAIVAIFGNAHLLQEFNDNFEKVVPISLFYDHAKDVNGLSKRIREFYFGEKKIDNTTREGVVDVSDSYIFCYCNWNNLFSFRCILIPGFSQD